MNFDPTCGTLRLGAAAIKLDLTIPPSANNLFANAGARRARSQAYRAWSHAAGWELATQLCNVQPKLVEGPVVVLLLVGLKRSVRADVDNRIKPVLDLLVKHTVIDDDRHVSGVLAFRGANVGRVKVFVMPDPMKGEPW